MQIIHKSNVWCVIASLLVEINKKDHVNYHQTTICDKRVPGANRILVGIIISNIYIAN